MNICKTCIFLEDKKLIDHHLYYWCNKHNHTKKLHNKCNKYETIGICG